MIILALMVDLVSARAGYQHFNCSINMSVCLPVCDFCPRPNARWQHTHIGGAIDNRFETVSADIFFLNLNYSNSILIAMAVLVFIRPSSFLRVARTYRKKNLYEWLNI